MLVFIFFFKQKTAYEMRISDWSSDVCSSDLRPSRDRYSRDEQRSRQDDFKTHKSEKFLKKSESFYSNGSEKFYSSQKEKLFEILGGKIGRASCRERVCQYV